jgi:hypothetical protein
VREILANLPTNVSVLHFRSNTGIGDAGMVHLNLIPDTVTDLNLRCCGLTTVGIKRLCKFLKSNQSITSIAMMGNIIGSEGVKEVADMMKVNNTLVKLGIESCRISSAADFRHLSEGLAQNTGLRELSMGCSDRFTDEHVKNICPGLALNKGLETLWLFCPLGSITETGVGYLETVLRTNVYLKYVAMDPENIPTGPGTKWNKMMYWLRLNKCNRKLLKDPNATQTQWRDAIILSSEAQNPDAIYMFLTNKPEWCMM